MEVFCVVIIGGIEQGKASINLCQTKSLLTPILLAVAINSSKKYGQPVNLVSLRNQVKSAGFVCSCTSIIGAFKSS